jgi:sodium/bile acid cotransporter 7
MMRVLTSGTGFVTLLVTVLLLALWNPAIGAKGNILHPEYLSEVLIVIIFLIQGIRINISRLSVILRKPFVSLALQAGIIMLPILWLNLAWVSGVLSEDLYGALFFTAILPTTISSCVVYSMNAKGNADYALGHATLSNLLAPFVIAMLWAGSLQMEAAFYLLIVKIMGLVVLPCFLGWLASGLFSFIRTVFGSDWLSGVPMFAVAFLLYLSLCDGIALIGKKLFFENVWIILPSCLGFVFIIHLSGWLFSGRWSKKRDIRVAQFYCLSQKSLASGIPIASILFTDSSEEILQFIMPLFCVHFLQLILGAVFFKPLRNWVEAGEI